MLKENDLLFAKVKEGAIIPTRNYPSAGYDVYACFEEDYLIINPHESKLIPTGIASAFSSDYVAILKERGSTGSKGMGERAGVVDADYRGEWFACITNHNDVAIVIAKESVELPLLYKDAIVYPYKKAICQALLIPVPQFNVIEIDYEQLKNNYSTKRGVGCLGSSNK